MLNTTAALVATDPLAAEIETYVRLDSTQLASFHQKLEAGPWVDVVPDFGAARKAAETTIIAQLADAARRAEVDTVVVSDVETARAAEAERVRLATIESSQNVNLDIQETRVCSAPPRSSLIADTVVERHCAALEMLSKPDVELACTRPPVEDHFPVVRVGGRLHPPG